MRNFAVAVTTFCIAMLLALSVFAVVSHLVVPLPSTEDAIRSAAGIFGLVAVPPLVALAAGNWRHLRSSGGLAPWRSVLALASLTVTLGAWVLFSYVYMDRLLRPSTSAFFNLDWSATLSYCSLLATVLAAALTGPARFQAMAASLLMLAWPHAHIYV